MANTGAARAAFALLPAVDALVPSLILDMSPFARDRSAFDRATASAPPPPPVEVRLTGIFRSGKELRASLMINGRSLVVRKNDETAAGKGVKIEPGAVVLSGGDRVETGDVQLRGGTGRLQFCAGPNFLE